MKCNHDLAEQESACAADGLCPLCMQAENEAMREALHRIVQWADAYPLSVFPMPDFARANEVLAAAGISMTAMSAANMRHVVEGVGKIARMAVPT